MSQHTPWSKIPLSLGIYAIVDTEDVEWLSKFKWSDSDGRASRSHRQNVGRRTVLMHREIIRARAHEFVDHINGNPLDNRKANLRICTNMQNTWNTRKRTHNRSGYKGVSKTPSIKSPWRASIKIAGKRTSLGCFATVEEAAKAYNEAAIKYQGEFARLNHVE